MIKRIAGVVLLSLISTLAQAGGGSAMLPHWVRATNHQTVVYVVNITNDPVEVNVNLTDYIGGSYASGVTSSNFTGDPTAGFATLAPQAVGMIQISSGTPTSWGHGMVNWRTSGPEKVAVVAYAARNYQNSAGGTSETMIPVNNYEPF